ncbi:helix-turn-helix domain-containing protein [Streptomyces albidoflavus]
MENRTFGQRVAYWRERRRLTQREFAALMEKSVRWVEDVEAGRRQADPQISVVRQAARHLHVTVAQLLDDDQEESVRCAGPRELEAVRAALHRHDVITGHHDTSSADPVTLTTLRRSLAHARNTFQAGRFRDLGESIPALLVDATRAAHHHDGDDRRSAYQLLALALELAEGALIKWGDPDLALLAGHRAVAAAEHAHDPVVQASSARHLADAMTHQGQPAAGADFAVTAAARLGDDLRTAGPDGLSMLGMLHLKAAMAAAAAAGTDEHAPAQHARAVPAHLAEATDVARHLGTDQNRLWSAFGPTNCLLYKAAAAVQLRDGATALEAARQIDPHARAALPAERRAHLLVDLALAHTQTGRRTAAVDTLLEAERHTPEEVRCRPRTRDLVQDLLLLGAGPAEGRLRALAGRCGLPR